MGVWNAIEKTDLLVLMGYVYPPSLEWKKLINQSSPILNEYPRDHLNSFPLQTRVSSFLIDSISPFWYRYTFLRGFFIGSGGGDENLQGS